MGSPITNEMYSTIAGQVLGDSEFKEVISQRELTAEASRHIDENREQICNSQSILEELRSHRARENELTTIRKEILRGLPRHLQMLKDDLSPGGAGCVTMMIGFGVLMGIVAHFKLTNGEDIAWGGSIFLLYLFGSPLAGY